jgi:hypothetical protein
MLLRRALASKGTKLSINDEYLTHFDGNKRFITFST